jgi:O-antigen/teichoic acid export membrane protein
MISYLRAKSGALSYFVLLELITQALSLSAGFLLIRLMEKQDYGLLTIANSLQAALIMLIDSGISAVSLLTVFNTGS